VPGARNARLLSDFQCVVDFDARSARKIGKPQTANRKPQNRKTAKPTSKPDVSVRFCPWRVRRRWTGGFAFPICSRKSDYLDEVLCRDRGLSRAGTHRSINEEMEMRDLLLACAPHRGTRLRNLRQQIGALASACLLALPVLSHATLLPDVTIIGDASLNKGGRKDLITFGSIGVSGSGAAAELTVSGTPLPTISAAAQAGPSGDIPGLFSRADAVLTYAFEIFGPADSVSVLIDVAGLAQGDGSAGASFAVTSMWQLFDSSALSLVLASDEIRSGQLSGRFNEGFDHEVSLTLLTNHIYPIFLLADAAAAATDTGSRAVASAIVDPRLSFGVGADPLAFSFVFSAGIGNELPPTPSSVPEPGTIGLLGAAAFVAGGFRRRSHRVGRSS
jgi:hypothetical protein